jgi:hypothetical protein
MAIYFSENTLRVVLIHNHEMVPPVDLSTRSSCVDKLISYSFLGACRDYEGKRIYVI